MKRPNCKCAAVCGTCQRAVNKPIWLAFVKTQWSSCMQKVRLLFWHGGMKMFHFWGGNVMIWIKIVRLAVSSYHRAGVLYDLFKQLSFSAPVMPPRLSWGEDPLSSRHVICTGCFHSHCMTLSLSLKYLRMYRPAGLRKQNKGNVADRVLLYALCERVKAFSSDCCLVSASHWCSGAVAATGLQQKVNDINYPCYNNCTPEQSSAGARFSKL